MAPKLIIEVVGDTSGLEKAFGRARSSIGGLAVSFGGLVKSIVVVDAVQKAIEGLSDTVHAGISEFKETTQIQAQTAAALKSTGDISGQTAKGIHSLSLELSNLSGQSDESIQSAENVLLSFTNIRDSLGKNNDVFTQATKTVVDFAARTGKDAPAAAVLLGKALQDPAKRVGILARAGVVLNQSQVKFLQTTEKGQGILAAQKILLGDLATRFQGAAAAAGQTLPGALNVLKERFRDLAGEGIAKVSGPLTDVTNRFTGFVVALTEAQGASGKLKVFTEGIRDWVTDELNAIKDAVGHVDFRAIGDAIEAKLKAIDWPTVISDGAQKLSDGLVAALNALTGVIKSVDWAKVGKAIVDGLVLAIAAVVKFLASVDWGKVAKAIASFLQAAVKAEAGLFEGIGKAVGQLLLAAIQKGLSAAGTALEKFALKIVLEIIEPFTHLPSFLGGGPFQDLKATIEKQLSDIGASGALSAESAGESIGGGLLKGIQSANGAIVAAFAGLTKKQPATGVTPTSTSPLSPPSPLQPVASDLLGTPTKPKGITADQRNTFFDNQISRLLDQASDGSLQQQITKLKMIGGLITARIAATKDVTRRLTLEQTLLDSVTRPLKADQAQVGQNFLDALQLGVDKAQGTQNLNDDLSTLTALQNGILARIKAVGKTQDLMEQLVSVSQQLKQTRAQISQAILDALNFNLDKAAATKSQVDDLAALSALEKALKKQIASEGDTLALQQQLFDVQQKRVAALAQQSQNRNAARNAAQFKAIGLTGTGDALIPGVKSLKAELGNVADSLAGSFLDTTKTRSLISHIRQVLSGGLGAVGTDVRDKIKGILDDLKNQINQAGGDQTKFAHTTINGLLAGAGLDSRTVNLLKQRFASVGAGGAIPATRTAAFAGGGINYNGPVTQNFHGITDVKKLKSALDKQAKNRPQPRRGT
jgi:hypothetical protein